MSAKLTMPVFPEIRVEIPLRIRAQAELLLRQRQETRPRPHPLIRDDAATALDGVEVAEQCIRDE